jgi:tRNA(fMet)-specific endonuclease VapC
MILLDTDVCIEILRKNEDVINKRNEHDDTTALSFMSVAELYYGAEKSSNPARNYSTIEEFLLTIEVVHSDIEILKKFGKLKRELYESKLVLPDADIFIAATALVKADRLATGNLKHFQRFPNLVVENWLTFF